MPDEKQQSSAAVKRDDGLKIPGARQLSFIEEKIGEWYQDQPRAVRAFVFVVFALVFCFSVIRLTAGDHAIRGQLWEHENQLATNTYDIEVDDRYGTNSQGTYYVVLPPMAYYMILLKGSAEVHVVRDMTMYPYAVLKDGKWVPATEVPFNRLARKFAQIKLIEAKPAEAQLTRAAYSFSLIPEAFADTPPVPTDRLFVERLGVTNLQATEGKVTLTADESSYPLMIDGAPARNIPLLGGQEVVLGDRFYFAIPQSLIGRKARISLSCDAGFFSTCSETFSVVVPQLGRSDSRTGANGLPARVTVRLLGSADVSRSGSRPRQHA